VRKNLVLSNNSRRRRKDKNPDVKVEKRDKKLNFCVDPSDKRKHIADEETKGQEDCKLPTLSQLCMNGQLAPTSNSYARLLKF